MKLTILLIERDESLRNQIAGALADMGHDVLSSMSLRHALSRTGTFSVDLAIVELEDRELVSRLLQGVKQANPKAQVVILTDSDAARSEPLPSELGARNYLMKPLDIEALKTLVTYASRSLKRRVTEKAMTAAVAEEYSFRKILGASEPLARALAVARQVANSMATSVLITGESGTGKELVAKAIHYQSDRKQGPFVDINCAAIPKNLLESELFGHEKGAFTDAVSEKIGLFEIADGGTVFLDEIGELDLNLQAKLLRFLDTRRFRRVMGFAEIPVDVRIVAATNRDLSVEVSQRRFRTDLFHRLNVVPIVLPPLRDRGDDALLLLDHFVARYAAMFGKGEVRVTPEARRLLQGYHWPGNVRELSNLVERAVLLSQTGLLAPEDFPIPADGAPRRLFDVAAGDVHVRFPEEGVSLDLVEKRVIEAALQMTGWNVLRAAKLLHLGRGALRYKIQRHGLTAPEKERRAA
jgi:DNA-binding NtrC family response regulator